MGSEETTARPRRIATKWVFWVGGRGQSDDGFVDEWVCWFRETRIDLSMEEVGCGAVAVAVAVGETLVGQLSMEECLDIVVVERVYDECLDIVGIGNGNEGFVDIGIVEADEFKGEGFMVG